jgi:hypothetical protein
MSGSFSGAYLNALANPDVANPVKAIGEGTQVANEVMRNREAQAQQAWGNALAQSVGPDGTVDYNKARALAAGNPRAAMGMMAGLKGASELSGAAQAQGLNTNQAISREVTSAMQLPDDQIHDGVAAGVQRLIDSGAIPRQTGMTILAKLPNDPTQLRQVLEPYRLSTATPEQREAGIYGTPEEQAAGGQILSGRRLPISQGGGFQPATSTTVTPGPGELDAPITMKDKNGREFITTRREFYRSSGIPIPGGTAPGPAGTVPAGTVPGTLRNPTKAQPAPTPAPAPAPATQPGPAGAPSGQSPAEQAEQTRRAEQSTESFKGEATADVQAQQQQATLGNMQADLAGFTSGTGADKTLDFKRAIQSWSPGLAKSFRIDPKEVSAQESFDKLVNQLLVQQGANSDNRMAINMAATPHSTQSPEGVDFIIRQLQGNADYVRARSKLAAASTDRTDYPAFQAKIADLDPRVFQLKRMTTDQQADYYKSLSPTDRDALKRSWQRTKELTGG